MKMYIFPMLFSCLVFAFLDFSYSSEIPVILWNIKGSPLRIQPVSAFDGGSSNMPSDVFEDSLNDASTGLVVFLIDKLSMEDLALQPYADDSNSTIKILETFLDQHPFMMHPNVKDPVKYLQKTECGIEDIYVTPNMEGRVHKSIAASLEHSCVVMVHLPHSSALSESGLLFNSEIFLPGLKTHKKNVIGMFTGKKSSWESAETLNRKARSLLALEEIDSHFINFTGCIIMFADNITVDIGNETTFLSFPPEYDGVCANNSELTLIFKDSGSLADVVIKFVFEQQARSWIISNLTIEFSGEKAPDGEIQLKSAIEAPDFFSYSCGRLVLESENSTTPVFVSLEGFQIQPFQVDEKFAESFNCVHWFTLPIWMGTFVVLLFLTILNIGVYFLFQAKTMDRFDDPKGKTITVPQTD